MNSISIVGFVDPVLIDQDNHILDGVTAAEAAHQLGLTSIPCVRATHLTDTEKRIEFGFELPEREGPLELPRIEG